MSTQHSGLNAEGIRVTTGGKVLVDGVDCTVPPGAVTALIGPNGAGKSTLLRALGALLRPDQGEVDFDGQSLLRLTRRERARISALVEQDAATELPLTVRAVVALGRHPWQGFWSDGDDDADRIVDGALDAVGMSSFADREVTTLSGGERQRVMLAKALAQGTRMLMLDEPTNHLDIGGQLAVLGLLRRLASSGTTVLAALHDLSLATGFSDFVIVLSSGRVVAAGRTERVLTPELIREVYGVDAVVLRHPVTDRPVLVLG